jgi:hypothetical protein
MNSLFFKFCDTERETPCQMRLAETSPKKRMTSNGGLSCILFESF